MLEHLLNVDKTPEDREVDHLIKSAGGPLGSALSRLRADAAVCAGDEQCRDLFDETSDLVQNATPEGRLLSANASWLRALGYTRAEVSALSVENLFEPESGVRYREAMHKALAGDGEQTLAATYLARDGHPVAVEGRLAVRRVSGLPPTLRFLCSDMSTIRRLEAQLLQAQKMEVVGHMTAGIAHDFNNLLTGVLGYTNLLIDTVPPEGLLQQGLKAMRTGGEKAAALTRQLLGFSRPHVSAPCFLNLNGIISDLERMFRIVLREAVEVVLQLDPTLPLVRVDRVQMEQVLLNLAVNSRDAMPKGGCFTITTNAIASDPRHSQTPRDIGEGNYVHVSVADTGCGMSEPVKANAFNPFFTTKEQGTGTGLGLAIVSRIVKQFDGFLDVESGPDLGTVFRIFLPHAKEERVPSGAAEMKFDWPRGSGTILVVDDDAGIRSLLRVLLVGHGYAILEAPDGLSAFALVEQHAGMIDLLIADIRMPALNGPALVERLAPLRPGMKVLYTSGEQASGPASRDRNVPFLQKPFSPRLLLKTVRELLGGMPQYPHFD